MSLSDSKYGGVPCSTCYYVSLVSGVSIEHCLIPVFINWLAIVNNLICAGWLIPAVNNVKSKLISK